MVQIERPDKFRFPLRVTLISACLSVAIFLVSMLLLSLFFSRNTSALKSVNETKAELLARSGIEYAVSQLKFGEEGAVSDIYDWKGEDWFFESGAEVSLEKAQKLSFPTEDALSDILVGEFVGDIKLRIIDDGAQININSGIEQEKLVRILSRLPGLDEKSARAVIDFRNASPGSRIKAKKELKNLKALRNSNYRKAEKYLSALEGEGMLLNVNTAPEPLLEAVLAEFLNSDASRAAANIISEYRDEKPFLDYNEFSSYLRAHVPEILEEEEIQILEKLWGVPDGTDKDVKLYLRSSGTYEVESLGILSKHGGRKIAQKKIRRRVKIFDSLTQAFSGSLLLDENAKVVAESSGNPENRENMFVLAGKNKLEAYYGFDSVNKPKIAKNYGRVKKALSFRLPSGARPGCLSAAEVKESAANVRVFEEIYRGRRSAGWAYDNLSPERILKLCEKKPSVLPEALIKFVSNDAINGIMPKASVSSIRGGIPYRTYSSSGGEIFFFVYESADGVGEKPLLRDIDLTYLVKKQTGSS